VLGEYCGESEQLTSPHFLLTSPHHQHPAMEAIDLVIIGAGPAGISTALHLLQADPGWQSRMIVLEKAAHPRHKLCGGGVTRYGLDLLRSLEFPRQIPLPQAPVEDARLVYKNRTVHVRGAPEFVVFHRAEFDAYLAAEARRRGVRILETTPVQELSLTPKGILLKTPAAGYQAQVVVGADGSKGLTRRIVGKTSPRQRVARLLEALHPADLSAAPFKNRSALFDFTPVQDSLQGYTWEFPAKVGGQPSYNRGIFDARIARSRPKAKLPTVLGNALKGWGADPAETDLQGHPIHWFSPRGNFSSARLILVGDAAGVDPLFGEGIGPALGYGKVAAEAIQAGFAQINFSFQGYRHRVLTSKVGRYLLLRWAIAWWGYRLSQYDGFMHGVWTFGTPIAWWHQRKWRGNSPPRPVHTSIK
jgi:flavin-dependent dehydrogenase